MRRRRDATSWRVTSGSKTGCGVARGCVAGVEAKTTLVERRAMRQCWTVAARATTVSGGAPAVHVGSCFRQPKMIRLLNVVRKVAGVSAERWRADYDSVAEMEHRRARWAVCTTGAEKGQRRRRCSRDSAERVPKANQQRSHIPFVWPCLVQRSPRWRPSQVTRYMVSWRARGNPKEMRGRMRLRRIAWIPCVGCCRQSAVCPGG